MDRFYRAYYLRPKPILRIIKTMLEDKDVCVRRLREGYEVNGQTAWSLLTKAERFRVQLISNLPEEDVRHMRMTPARTLEEALARTDADEPGYVLPRGAAFMPFVAG